MVRNIFGMLSIVLFTVSCFSSHSTKTEGETNWLRMCETQTDCGNELSCICGTCTKPCDIDRDCRGALTDLQCVSIERISGYSDCDTADSVDNGVCELLCTQDSDCRKLSDDFECLSGSCRQLSFTRPIDSVVEDATISSLEDASNSSPAYEDAGVSFPTDASDSSLTN